MKLKICGLTRNLQKVAQLHPDYLGFNFWAPSSRYFKGEIPQLPQGIKKVGIFVDAPLEKVLEKITQHQLHGIQLHGQESPQYCQALRLATDYRNTFGTAAHNALTSLQKLESTTKDPPQHMALDLIKAFAIKDHFDFSALQAYEKVCNYFLFDTKGKLPGGNGYTFDWSVLKAYPFTKPYFLSGGIGLDHVSRLLAFLQQPEAQHCHAIDINSKFELEPGHKDVDKLKNFMLRVITPTPHNPTTE